MDCEEARGLLHDRVSGELSAEEEEAFGEHLAGCSPCAASVEGWTQFRRRVGERGRGEDMPAGLRERVAARLEKERAVRRPLRRFETVLALVASIAIVVGLGLALFTTRPAGGPLVLASLDPVMTSALADHDFHGNDVRDAMGAGEQQKMLGDYSARLGSIATPASVGAYRRARCLLCPLGGEKFPHVSYVDGARTVSLYVVPAKSMSLPPGGRFFTRHEKDETLLAWDSNGMVYMLISREPEQTLLQLAAAFRADGG